VTPGISLKTQELYLLVFVCRYLDLFTNFLSMYNTVMKILYIFTAAAIVYMIRFREPWSITYKKEEDSFKHWKFVVAPCAVLAFLICDNRWSPMEVLWTFSIYCEAVAIMPQVVILTRYGDVENLTAHYVFSLGAYRALYLVNWIYRYNTEPYYRAWIVWGAGIVQTALYLDFFYYYAKRCGSAGAGAGGG
jgi:ER lumen protein retaining receptor